MKRSRIKEMKPQINVHKDTNNNNLRISHRHDEIKMMKIMKGRDDEMHRNDWRC